MLSVRQIKNELPAWTKSPDPFFQSLYWIRQMLERVTTEDPPKTSVGNKAELVNRAYVISDASASIHPDSIRADLFNCPATYVGTTPPTEREEP